jgi:hypothetical protein
MSSIHTLQLSARLNQLERNIREAKLVEFEELPTDQDLATRKLIEYAKPTRMLGENVRNKHIGSSFDEFVQGGGLTEPAESEDEDFKMSFREVLRLAKSGQQAWWTEELKNSTENHIERLDEYYRQNYCDETTD